MLANALFLTSARKKVLELAKTNTKILAHLRVSGICVVLWMLLSILPE